MRLAGALCVCVNAHFFYCCFPPISQSLLDHLFFSSSNGSQDAAHVHVHAFLWMYDTHAPVYVCVCVYIPPVFMYAGVHRAHVCVFVYGQFALRCV